MDDMSTTPPPGPSDPTHNPYERAYGEEPTAPIPVTRPETPPYGPPTAQLPPSYGPATGSPAPERPRRRGGLAAAVVATSLLVGGLAGVGGAAAWDAAQDDEPGSTRTSQTTPVVDQGDTEAEEGSVESVAATVLPSVVKIDVLSEEGSGSGSGIILTDDGTILTNNHVVETAADGGAIRVSFSDGSTADAEILGTDPLTDTAVIRAEDVTGLQPATIGQSANLDVGQGVVAIGSPFGLDATVTSGIVSALDRPVNAGADDAGNSTTYPAIQTDAAINPGNSGGPLVDMTGAVVGINSSIRTAASSVSGPGGSIGLGFAIPIDEVMPIVDQMAAGETPTHARLGIQVGSPEDGSAGAVLIEVSDGSTAEEAGLQPGDVITRIDDQRIVGADSLVATIRSYRPGDTVEVVWTRDGEEQSAEVVLDSDAE
jgi:putative serine protease PepD